MVFKSILATVFVLLGANGQSVSATEIKYDPTGFSRSLIKLALEKSNCRQLQQDLREAQRRKNLYHTNKLTNMDSMALISTSQPWNEVSADSRPQLAQGRYKVIADRLLVYLNSAQPYTVSERELVAQAFVASGGDLLAALGAIGTLFQDKNFVEINNRMLPLFIGRQDYPESYNIGFWQQLNSNLIHVNFQKKYTRWMPKRLSEQQLAENLGFETGLQMHALIENRLECKKLEGKK